MGSYDEIDYSETMNYKFFSTPLEEIRVWKIECGVKSYTIYFQDGHRTFTTSRGISGLSEFNLQYAIVEPKLFRFFILSNEVLHVICPYLSQFSGSMVRYLKAAEKDFEEWYS